MRDALCANLRRNFWHPAVRLRMLIVRWPAFAATSILTNAVEDDPP